ncbi:MAG: ScpA family protein [Pseudomonadota bacterium]
MGVSDHDDFEEGLARVPMEEDEEEMLSVSLSGFEGPLDLLLDLARRQKVDLRRISVLALAEQYLAFVERARRLRIDIAADYLVMAAWLAYLKSRLLLPEPAKGDEPSGEELADRLAHRLARLEAMRRAGEALMTRDRLGLDVFPRGRPEAPAQHTERRYRATVGDLLKAYTRVQTREAYRPLAVDGRAEVLSLEEARARLERMLGGGVDWQRLDGFLPEGWDKAPERRRSAVASSFAAALELARQGEVEIRQDEAFAPIHIRRKAPDA